MVMLDSSIITKICPLLTNIESLKEKKIFFLMKKKMKKEYLLWSENDEKISKGFYHMIYITKIMILMTE